MDQWNIAERLRQLQATQPAATHVPREWLPREHPKIACCNFIPDVVELRDMAMRHGFDGVEWSLALEDLPQTPEQEEALRAKIATLDPLEVRYHCAFDRTDLGDSNPQEARLAMRVFRRVCRLVTKLGGRVVTIHIGLGHDSTIPLSWDRTIESLAHLVRYADGIGVQLCLENLAWGWTSRPELFEKLIRKAQPFATLDIGHARVSPSVSSQHYDLEDFVAPQLARFRNAHIYHEEEGGRHVPPPNLSAIADRLRLVRKLPACDWWVLELRNETDLLQTLSIVRRFLDRAPAGTGAR
jgi:hypothetical protein